MKGTIAAIVEPMKQRTSKAGKPYNAMSIEVELENGEAPTILSFEEQQIGDVVELEKNGQYWQIKKVNKLDTILEALRLIFKQNTDVLEGLNKLLGVDAGLKPETPAAAPQSGYEQFKEAAQKIKSPAPDVIVEDIGDEPINLDDVPF